MSLVATKAWRSKWELQNPTYLGQYFNGFVDRKEDLKQDDYNCGIYFCSVYTVKGIYFPALVDLFSINGVSVIGCTCYISDKEVLEAKGWVTVYTYNSPKKKNTKLCFMIYEIKDMYQKGYGLYTGKLKPIEETE